MRSTCRGTRCSACSGERRAAAARPPPCRASGECHSFWSDACMPDTCSHRTQVRLSGSVAGRAQRNSPVGVEAAQPSCSALCIMPCPRPCPCPTVLPRPRRLHNFSPSVTPSSLPPPPSVLPVQHIVCAVVRQHHPYRGTSGVRSGHDLHRSGTPVSRMQRKGKVGGRTGRGDASALNPGASWDGGGGREERGHKHTESRGILGRRGR